MLVLLVILNNAKRVNPKIGRSQIGRFELRLRLYMAAPVFYVSRILLEAVRLESPWST